MSTGPEADRYRGAVPRARIHPPEDIYPADPWCMIEKRFSPEFLAQSETIFALANGYLGMRGDFEEGTSVSQGGTFLNGFYESWPIAYGEWAYGFAENGETIVDVIDGKRIRLYVDDEPFEVETARLLDFRRTLDMREGLLRREILWETPAGKRFSVRSTRLVSMVHRHLALVDYEVRADNEQAHILLVSQLVKPLRQQEGEVDPRKSPPVDGRVLEPVAQRAEGRRAILGHRTRTSGLLMACGMDHVVETDSDVFTEHARCEPDGAELVFSAVLRPGQAFRLTKLLAYHHGTANDADEILSRAERTLRRAAWHGCDFLIQEQREHMASIWEDCDVEVEASEGQDGPQQAVRFNLWQLLQATLRAEGFGVPAKGLTGQGYEGHYFWDSEVFVLPFVIYTQPKVARNLLEFRCGLLDHGRARAKELGGRGALFAWRTISGRETSAYYAAGTAQVHIDADVAYAVRKYVEVTGDLDFMSRTGAEVLVETARFWLALGCYPPTRDGAFCIHGVTGPDEYTAVVDNNCYTNMMARENLSMATAYTGFLRERDPEAYARLVRATGLEESEPAAWQRAAESMYLPTDEKTGIYKQDDTFLEKAVWDFANTPPDHHPLLLHYHPLVIYRHQVIKQADVVMALFLLGDEFSEEEKRRSFDYYDPLTTRDSSLSSCVQSILATELGYEDKATEYFIDAALVDLADIGGNVTDGVHIASMGGAWMAIVYGFGGLRDHDGTISFRPRLPGFFKRFRFRLQIRGQRLEVAIEREGTTYTLIDGSHLAIHHDGEELTLEPGQPVRR